MANSIPFIKLQLEDALDKALQNNKTYRQQKLDLVTAENAFHDAWEGFYLPAVSLDLGATSTLTVGQLGNSTAKSLSPDSLYTGYPNSNISLSLGNYTLFNFGRDHLAYEIAKLNYDRSIQKLEENKRTLRFQVMRSYFELKTGLDKIEVAQRSVDFANIFLEIVKTNVATSKADSEDLNSVEGDLLTAKKDYSTAVRSSYNSIWKFNLLLGDPIDTRYILTTEIELAPLKISLDDALKAFVSSAPSVRDSILAKRIAEINLDLAEKNRLPLPTVSFSGIVFSMQDSYYKSVTGLTTNAVTPGNLDISAAIKLHLPFLWPGGLFNSRVVSTATVAVEQADLSAERVLDQARIELYSLLADLKENEEMAETQKQSLESALKVLEDQHKKLQQGEIDRLKIRDSIQSARTEELNFKDALLRYLATKLNLLEQLGTDDWPPRPQIRG